MIDSTVKLFIRNEICTCLLTPGKFENASLPLYPGSEIYDELDY